MSNYIQKRNEQPNNSGFSAMLLLEPKAVIIQGAAFFKNAITPFQEISF